MQLYKIHLHENHNATSEQVIDGYLASFPNTLGLYTRKEALKKAIMFGGTIEKHGKNYTTNNLSMIQLSKKEISKAVLNELYCRESHKDTECDENIYQGDVFMAILNECEGKFPNALNENPSQLMDELETLNTICANFDYVMIV